MVQKFTKKATLRRMDLVWAHYFYIGKETPCVQANHAIGLSYSPDGPLDPTLKALLATALGSRTPTPAWC